MRSCKYAWLLLTALVWTLSVQGQKSSAGSKQKSAAAGWRSLFNGRDLTGWDSWLRSTKDWDYNEPWHEPIGLKKDPMHVFTVHDGMLHVSGEVWGAVTYKEDFGNYHLRFQSKWGEKKYAPKDTLPRDGGVLFHCTDSFNYAFNCWMRSMEMQVQEGEIGDFFNVGAGDAESQVTTNVRTIYHETADQYDPRKPMIRHPGRIWRSGNFETPDNGWTTGELIARHSDAVFIVNGFVVNRLFNIYRNDLREQVTHGKIQFQSEGAEQFYKNIEIRPISFRQTHPRLIAPDTSLTVKAGDASTMEIVNRGEPVEIIAAELIGQDIDQFVVKLPALPIVLKKGEKLSLPVRLKDGYNKTNSVIFRLETVLGPVEGFRVNLFSK